MADKGVVLSTKDAATLKLMVDDYNRRIRNGPPDLGPDWGGSPEIYVAKVNEDDPNGYLPALVGTTPGEAICDLWKINWLDDQSNPVLERLETAGGTPLTKERVFNVYAQGIPGCLYFVIRKAKNGSWIPEPVVVPPYKLTDCEGKKPTTYVLNDLAAYVGRIVKAGGTCWTVECGSVSDDNAGVAVRLDIVNDYDDCQACLCCWEMTPCTTGTASFITNSDLAQYEGKIVRLSDDECYLVSRASSCSGAYPCTVEDWYETCDLCGPCYTVTECVGTATFKVLNDLAALAGVETPAEVISGGWVFEINGVCVTATSYDSSGCDAAESYSGIPEPTLSCDSCGCVVLTETDCVGTDVGTATIVVAKAYRENTSEQINLRDHVGKIVRSYSSGDLYTISVTTEDCSSATTFNVAEIYDNCDDAKCWRLDPCNGTPDVITYKDLAGLGASIGQYVQSDPPGTCYLIQGEAPFSGGVGDIDLEMEATAEGDPQKVKTYSTCETCAGTTRFRLTANCFPDGCEDPGDIPDIVTTTDLTDAVGQWVEYRGLCYTVSQVVGTADEVTHADIEYSGPYGTCALCQASGKDVTLEVVVKTGDDFRTVEMTFSAKKVCPGASVTDPCDVGTGT